MAVKKFEKGTFGYDVQFMQKHQPDVIVLKDSLSGAAVLISPEYQGRVMTSTANGNEGTSFGWINHNLIESGKLSAQFNAFGGEERIWLGPEGGPFSIYFPEGKEQIFSNWQVPRFIDTGPFDVKAMESDRVSFGKEFEVKNYSGTTLKIGIERTIKLLSQKQAEAALGMELDQSLNYVAYESENILINKGQTPWNESNGFLSIWMLSMFNPSEGVTVFIPFKGSEKEPGKVVNDDYFGEMPADRLKVEDGIIYFKIDGKFRSKIGIPPARALPFCGSYDSESKTLTILWYSLPDKVSKYVNSKWGKQDDPLSGDVVNSYNDGPVEDGSVMGPFYEIESSSPAAMLTPGEEMMHIQRIFHITGDENQLDFISLKLFNISIQKI
ncbi:MAG: hypothetical protein HC906_04330 [Bacteroidales bacterium]|nr:hypothetical protein [Bacteroidales bacterium]